MFRIGELANACGIKADTLRFYEKHQLLSPSLRSEAGYRLYSESDKQRLQFILRAKQIGFSLKEISELLAIQVDRNAYVCEDVKQLAEEKLGKIEAQIRELRQFHQALSRISAACCGGPESAAHCTILEALETQEQGTPDQEVTA